MKLQKNLFKGTGRLTQRFGVNAQAYAKFGLDGHNGIDYGIPNGTELYSAINGKVTETAYDTNGYGKYVKVENDECGVIYAHLQDWKVKVGQKVNAGQILGLSNNTGNSTGPHLHFGVFPKPRDRKNGYAGYINPLDKKLVTWVDEFKEDGEKLDPTKQLPKVFRDTNEFKEVVKLKLAKEGDAFDTLLEKLLKVYREQDIEIKDLSKQLEARDRSIADYKKKVAEMTSYKPTEGTNLPPIEEEKPMEYPNWKKALVEGRRIFVGAMIAQLILFLPSAEVWLGEVLREPKQLLPLLIIPTLTAGYKAITKYLQEQYGEGNYSKFIYKL